ncbi:MAG: IclR family transcriptional regulator [Vicinamibacterales bacterium]
MATSRSRTPERPAASRRKKSAASARARYRIQSLDRAAAILDCFVTKGPELTVREVSDATGLHKSTAHRILMALQGNGFIEQDEAAGRYHLGLQLVKLGEHAVGRLDVRVIARPHVADLAAELGETVLLAVLDGEQVVILDRVDGVHSATTPSRPGRLFPAYCTALGKAMLAGAPDQYVGQLFGKRQLRRLTPRTTGTTEALLADLRDVRARGYSVADGEIAEDLSSVGAAIRNHLGEVVAAVSVTGLASRMRERGLDALGERVRDVAARISARLGHAPTTAAPRGLR